MAVKIRVKQGGDDQDKPKQEEPKGKVKVKVRATTVPDIEKDPNIKGPIGFLNSYYSSPLFAQRYKDLNKVPHDNAGALAARKYYKAVKGSYPGTGSHSVPVEHLRAWEDGKVVPGKSPTVSIDTVQAKQHKMDINNDVIPHEYSHGSRALTIAEEKEFAGRNKAPNVMKKHPINDYLKSDEYKEEIKYGNTENLYSDFLAQKGIDSHDEQPNENYSDLNSLRYMMYKQGIYDTRKGPMTIDHIKKAMNDPWLKKQFTFQRMLKTFKPEDIIKLNNTIAANKKKQNQNTA